MNLLVTGAFDWAEKELNMLRALGHEVVFMQQETAPLPCEPAWVEGVVGNGLFLSHPIRQFSALKYIQLTSAGFDRVPMDYVQAHKIEIHNARGVYSVPMAEFAVGGVLQLYKQSEFFRRNQRNHRWEKCREIAELNGKTVCILGCGSVGNECAKRFRAFGCSIIGVDNAPYQSDVYDAMVSLDGLISALTSADITVLTLPLTEETRHLINAECLAAMKSDSMLVNIARGAIVDTAALTDALKTNAIQGAVLDVFEDEPLAENSELWDLENVIVTPHNSFVSSNNHLRLLEVIFRNLKGLEK